LAKLVAAIADKGLGIVTMGGAAAPKDSSKWDAVVNAHRARKEYCPPYVRWKATRSWT
jgi:hypothetical protein